MTSSSATPGSAAYLGSRWNAGRALRHGVRVMVRTHLRDGDTSHLLTDVLGTVEALAPQLQVRSKDGRLHTIAHADIAVLKVLPPRPILVRDIRTLSHAVALGWPGTDHEIVDGWLCRAGDDWSYRRGGAVPVHPWATDADLAAPGGVMAWYHARGLAPWLELPTRLVRPEQLLVRGRRLDTVAHPSGSTLAAALLAQSTGEVEVRTAEIDELLARTGAPQDGAPHDDSPHDNASRETVLRAAPEPEFLRAYHATADLPAAQVLPALQARGVAAAPAPSTTGDTTGDTTFVHIYDGGQLAAFARGSLSAAPRGPLTLGISCVETTAPFRRQGLARDVVHALAAWGAARGATCAQLHVFVRNSAGLALWDELGFHLHHRTVHVPLAAHLPLAQS